MKKLQNLISEISKVKKRFAVFFIQQKPTSKEIPLFRKIKIWVYC